jgi:glycosyltransferase involved in cell wall biosynthesis
MPPLNVLWIIDHVCYDGSLHGGGRLFMNLVPAFDADEVRIFPYFLRASDEVRRLFAASPVQVTDLGKGKYDPTTTLTLHRLCRRHRIDVMHLFCYASSTFGRVVGAVTGVPTVVHDFDTQIYFPYPLYLRVLDRWLASSTGYALAASPMCRDYMRDRRRVPAGRLEVMPHAIPPERFQAVPAQERLTARASLGWGDETVFCTLTKLGPDRGNEELLRAFATLAARRRDVRLVLVYKPTLFHRIPEAYRHLDSVRDPKSMSGALEAMVAQLGVADRVHLVEAFDQPDRYLGASDVIVVPFLDQRFSSVHLLEAFARGLPAIATDLGEQRELIRHGEQGLLVPPGNEASLTAAMEELAKDPARRRSMGRAAKALAYAHSTGAAARRLTHLYARLAARPLQDLGLVAGGRAQA